MKQAHLDNLSPKWRELMERHPAMFEHLWHPPECAEGWCELLDELMTDLEAEMSTIGENDNQKDGNDNEVEKNVNLKVVQIKEKFGGLRFYVVTECSLENAMPIQDLILAAENKSFSICEFCGEKGELRRKQGWMRTLCDAHYEEWINDGK